ncbi:MAG: ArsI/CadI family heavy metal resistance metalloenzyme [Gammaproteobacteria bacterium]|jgi:catechol 2,3-dioxygenase-like lactoylglutathione lyase family enzyme
MSRFHIHIAVDDIAQSVKFYSAVFGAEPSIVKDDYAKWALEDPRLNFAISTRGSNKGLDHVGLQAENDDELNAIRARLEQAGINGLAQEATTCCYAESDKYWVQDPAGIAWETFHTLSSAPVFGEQEAVSQNACCTPNLSKCC